jgi:hypothetical protein
VRVVDSGELFVERTRLDADAKLVKIIGGQEDNSRCSGRHVCGELKVLDKSNYNLCNNCSCCRVGVRKGWTERLVMVLAEERKERGRLREDIEDRPSSIVVAIVTSIQ